MCIVSTVSSVRVVGNVSVRGVNKVEFRGKKKKNDLYNDENDDVNSDFSHKIANTDFSPKLPYKIAFNCFTGRWSLPDYD